MGRSGSTMLCNWLARPPEQLVFIEPFFLRTENPRLLRIQLADFQLAADDEEWSFADPSPSERFRRLMLPRLRGRRWAFKEVLCDEHRQVIDVFRPARVIITVRNIVDVALSFFEKHRIQGNLDRFDDQWVRNYCVRESAGLVRFSDLLNKRRIAHRVVRYEDFTHSDEDRAEIVRFVGWTPGGDAGAHLSKFDRGFELERHGNGVSGATRKRAERALGTDLFRAAEDIGADCALYQCAFGYS